MKKLMTAVDGSLGAACSVCLTNRHGSCGTTFMALTSTCSVELPGIEPAALPGLLPSELPVRYISFPFSTPRYLRFRFGS
jgi:hypothetical protein